MLRFLRSLSFVLVAAGLLTPAAAHAASKKKKTAYPTVSSIKPRKITIGQTLTVKGKHFRAGKGKSSVVFYRKGRPVVFVKADRATSTSLTVKVPGKVADLLVKRGESLVATQLRLRIVGRRMGKAWTKNSRSPIVSPVAVKSGGSPGTPAPGAPGAGARPPVAASGPTCQQLAALAPTSDTDADGLANGLELGYRLDPCNPDTDLDGMTDGYEYYSALDLNGAAYPYPGLKPWPNPLDPTDSGAKSDFDGDGLNNYQEYSLWAASKSGFPLTQYSAGLQSSGGGQPTTVATQYLDLDRDGNLTDDERDFDGDGLSNMVELNFRLTQGYWLGVYKDEKPYILRQFAETNPLLADSDGDGIPDGADDQDNDGWSNFAEAQLSRAQVGYRVQPFNPCLPDPHSPTCSRYVLIDSDPWPPFDHTQGLDDAIPFGWPNVDRPTWNGTPPGLDHGSWDPVGWFAADGWDGMGGPQG